MPEYRYFSEQGDPRLFCCSETGERGIKEVFVRRLDRYRAACGFPLVVTSGFRSPQHTKERDKSKPGTHTQGIAADFKVLSGAHRRIMVRVALEMGFNGIGVAKDFVHVDDRKGLKVMWTY